MCINSYEHIQRRRQVLYVVCVSFFLSSRVFVFAFSLLPLHLAVTDNIVKLRQLKTACSSSGFVVAMAAVRSFENLLQRQSICVSLRILELLQRVNFRDVVHSIVKQRVLHAGLY